MKRKLQKLVAVIGLIAFCLLGSGGAMGAESQQLPAGGVPGTTLGSQKENSTSKPNDPGNSAVVDGGFAGKGLTWAKDQVTGLFDGLFGGFSSDPLGWMKDRATGIFYGVAIGLATGLVIALLVTTAPLGLLVGAAVAAGAVYGLFTGAAKFNVLDCVIFSALGALSAVSGLALGAAGARGWGLKLAKTAINAIGGGLAMAVSYLVHTDSPGWSGAGHAFAAGAAGTVLFMGLGSLAGKVLAPLGNGLSRMFGLGRGAATAGEAAAAGGAARGGTSPAGGAVRGGSTVVDETFGLVKEQRGVGSGRTAAADSRPGALQRAQAGAQPRSGSPSKGAVSEPAAKPDPDLYRRPTGFRNGVREKAWEAATGPDGMVKDPNTGEVIKPGESWDMGHKPGYEFRKHQQSARERGITREQFLDEHNNPEHYQPEMRKSNRGRSGEDKTDRYKGP